MKASTVMVSRLEKLDAVEAYVPRTTVPLVESSARKIHTVLLSKTLGATALNSAGELSAAIACGAVSPTRYARPQPAVTELPTNMKRPLANPAVNVSCAEERYVPWWGVQFAPVPSVEIA